MNKFRLCAHRLEDEHTVMPDLLRVCVNLDGKIV